MDVLCLCLSGDDPCHVMWRDVIQLVTTLLVTMKHVFVPHAVDFIGVHVETVISVCVFLMCPPINVHLNSHLICWNLLRVGTKCR